MAKNGSQFGEVVSKNNPPNFLGPTFGHVLLSTPKTTSPRHCIFSSTKDNSPSNVLNFNMDLGLKKKQLVEPDHRGPLWKRKKI